MNNDLRYRAWDKKKKRMFYPSMVGPHAVLEGSIWHFDEEGYEHKIYNPFVLEIMQFTGFEDKNLKEVWESDIVRDPENHVTGVVTWINGAFYNLVDDKTRYLLDMTINTFNGEVIGNIYQNPNLI